MNFFKKFKMRCAFTRASIISLLFPFVPNIEHADTEKIQRFDQVKFKKNADGKKD